jgi:CheY-like chemotaxis protein
VSAYAEFAPDVILMDINMPDMDGFEAIAKIREAPGGGHTLICTLSGHGTAHAQRAFEAGADGHLVKPIGRAELSAVLARA